MLNDNEWSIDRNVGAIANYLHKMVTNEHYTHLHARAGRLIERFGGKTATKVVRKAEEAAKGLLWPSMLFEEFGLNYYGPLDGHNLELLIGTFKFLKQQEKPVLLHVLTQKGRGFQPALEKVKEVPRPGTIRSKDGRDQAGRAADLLRGLCRDAGEARRQGREGCRDHGGDAQRHGARPIPAASSHAVLRCRHRGGARGDLRRRHGDRGYRPFCAIYSTFLQRAFDPIVHDVCLQNLPVIFCMDRGGLSGDDGATHHGLFDISYLRGIPNVIHMVPKDEDELADMMQTALAHKGPSAIRYPRGTGTGVTVKGQPVVLPIGKAEIIRDGDEIAVLGLGALLPMAAELADVLEREGRSVAVINPRFVKPLDREMLAQYARKVQAFVTFEDHVLMGGFGSAVLEALSEMGFHTPVVRIGWPDRFIEHGKVEALRAKHGISVEAALEKLEPLLKPLPKSRLVAR